jgi:hypothetical protein
VKTATQREEEFRADLKALLEKHGAEIVVTDDGWPGGMQPWVCTITMKGKHGKDGETLEEFVEFYL